ncbi:hypothetical protein DPSP01_001755 [Paraphaeosphaeria sporulosa]
MGSAAVTNRFALFTDGDEERSPVVPLAPDSNTFVNQVTDNDAPWEEVRRGGQAAKSNLKTLVIRDENKTTVRCYTKTRDVSGSTQDSDNMKLSDPHEHWCGVCHIRFPNKNALLTHVKLSPQQHKNYCNLCKRVFVDRNGLKNHVDNAAGHDVTCNLCLSAFKDAWGLKNHFENNYFVAGHDFVCLTCLLGFRTQKELDKHLFTGAKHILCHTCHRKFRNQAERDEHWRLTTKHRHCLQPGCDFDAPDEKALEAHLHDDHFQCEGCKRIFPSQTKLNLHCETCQFEVTCNCGFGCAGRAKLELHMENCFYCSECRYQTCHESNYQIHMTKHDAAAIPCWHCSVPMRNCSTLINHLESGSCVKLPDPTQLMRCLGTFWYSTLYMDVDIHVQIRSNRVDIGETVSWMKEGLLQPFICRSSGCGKTFNNFSSLVAHVENQECEWDVEKLRLDLVQAEFRRMCARKDSFNATTC